MGQVTAFHGRIMTSNDVALELRMSAHGVRAARDRGDIVPAGSTVGGVQLFDEESVRQFRHRRETWQRRGQLRLELVRSAGA